ncbi:hypothetical protein AAFC00_006084 [Neodothiora populina]
MHQNNNSDDLYKSETRDSALERVRTAGTISMSPELFERLYLGPQTKVSGDLRKTFGNPTPLGLIGFVVGLTPLACCLMGWRGAGGLGTANIGVYFFIGGPLLMFSGILEFFLGNTFPFLVFVTYGGIFLALGGTLQSFYGSATIYSPTLNFYEGLQSPGFNASLAFFPLVAALLNVYFMVAATRINAVFTYVFAGSAMGFILFASFLWALAEGSTEASGRLLVGTGGAWFATVLGGWYLLAVQMLGVAGFSLALPVGDFSAFWERRKNKKTEREHSA